MKTLLSLVLSLGLCIMLVAPAQARPKVTSATINLRACIDAGDGACLTEGDQVLDGITICLQGPNEEIECRLTEDGEYMWDSQPRGHYSAYVQGVPAGFELAGATCTTYPADLYKPCKVRGNEVFFLVKNGTEAVNINFLFSPIDD